LQAQEDRGKRGQAVFQLPGDAGEIGKHAVRKFLFTEFIPHMFLRIQFWSVGRQSQQADVLRDQILRDMRTCAIDDHDDDLGGMRFLRAPSVKYCPSIAQNGDLFAFRRIVLHLASFRI
jgi:hypothetical protein